MKTSHILSLVLASQLLLAAGISWNKWHSQQSTEPSQFIAFDTSLIDHIEVEDGTNKSILQKQGGQWRLQSNHLSADQAKVNNLLTALHNLQAGWPITTTSSSLERMEVSEKKYQRHLYLYQGDEMLGEYYFGTSPAFRQTHGRSATENDVYSLAINNFDMPGDSNDWLDKTVLRVSDVQSIESPNFQLGLKDGNWQLASAQTGERTLEQTKVTAMVNAFKNLSVLKAVGNLPEGETISVTVNDGKADWTYTFLADGDNYFIRRQDMDTGFTISKTNYNLLAGTSLDDLLTQDENESDTEPTAPEVKTG